jgi:DNA polymerase
MFVGEGPGFHEDRLGEPFVGQAGKLLTTLLGQIGLTRGEVYIANVVKCRPPENRDPTDEEIKACSPHLMKQIAIIRPRVICTLGRFATHLLADTEVSMTAIHGRAKPVVLGGVETVVFPVFHPAAALYTPANRTVLEEDFAKLRHLLLRGPDVLRASEDDPEPEAATCALQPSSEGGGAAGDRNGVARVSDPGGRSTTVGRVTPANREEQLPLW